MNNELIAKTLKDAHDYIMLDRDCLYEAITLEDGSIPDETDRLDLKAVDELLDEMQEALASVQTGPEQGA